MFQITGEYGHVDGDDYLYLMRLRDTHQLQELLHGACEDDVESKCPYISLLPEESGKENGSPINYVTNRRETDVEIDAQIEWALSLNRY